MHCLSSPGIQGSPPRIICYSDNFHQTHFLGIARDNVHLQQVQCGFLWSMGSSYLVWAMLENQVVWALGYIENMLYSWDSGYWAILMLRTCGWQLDLSYLGERESVSARCIFIGTMPNCGMEEGGRYNVRITHREAPTTAWWWSPRWNSYFTVHFHGEQLLETTLECWYCTSYWRSMVTLCPQKWVTKNDMLLEGQ